MHPVLFNFFGLFNLHTYGLMIAAGFLIGMQLGAREARRVDTSAGGRYDQFILDLTFWILIAAMVGARVLFIVVEWQDDYGRDPLKIFRIWEGGLVFYGGLIGAVLFSIYYSWRKGWQFLFVADTLIPSVALGQFFGRIGCFAAGCCWGDPVDPSHHFATQFPEGSLIHSSMERHGIIAPDAAYTIHVHPVQLYESLGNLVIFSLLILLRTQKRFHGMVLAGYLFLYPVLRFIVEGVRGDAERGENVLGTVFSTSQMISIALFLAGVGIVVYKMSTRKSRMSRVSLERPPSTA